MSNTKRTFLNWVEINKKNFSENVRAFRKLIRSKTLLAPAIKANAYGHGTVESAKIVLASGADWVCVNALYEAQILRRAGIASPIYILGYMMKNELPEAVRLNLRMVVYNKETISTLSQICRKMKKGVRVHMKVETGNNRQGVPASEAVNFARYILNFPEIELEGITTHFANIEDIDPRGVIGKLSHASSDCPPSLSTYPSFQLETFRRVIAELESNGIFIPVKHCANSAAALMFPETHFDLVRPGIAIYGMWPSPKTAKIMKKLHPSFELKPVLSWKTRIAQIKDVPAGSYIGYGCTYRTPKNIKMAILPIGYYDGYDRGFSGKSHVLIHGKAAKVLGRICMNIMMVDITNIKNACVEDCVVLLGKDGKNEITAEYLGDLIGTINYEITTRINERIPRVVV